MRTSLLPGTESRYQRVPLDGEPNEHPLSQLKPRTPYEVKLSFFGPRPAAFAVHIGSSSAANARAASASSRKLLDVEKATFRTDVHGRVAGSPEASAFVSAQTVGFYRVNVTPPTEAHYNIALGEVMYGMPKEAFSLAPWLLLCLLAAVFVMPRTGRRIVRSVLDT